jgi:hypothetical protein
VLGPDVDIVDQAVRRDQHRVRADRIIADIQRSGGKALICLVGVQSNQFPRAVDSRASSSRPACRWRWAASMPRLPVDAAGRAAEIQAAMDMGISIFAGEAEEGRSTRCCSTPGTAR